MILFIFLFIFKLQAVLSSAIELEYFYSFSQKSFCLFLYRETHFFSCFAVTVVTQVNPGIPAHFTSLRFTSFEHYKGSEVQDAEEKQYGIG